MRVKIRMGTRRKAFVAPVETTPAHSDYDVVEHFHMIREGGPRSGYPFNTGESVAVLQHDDDGFRIVYGRMYAMTTNHAGAWYSVVTREGEKLIGVRHSHMAHI